MQTKEFKNSFDKVFCKITVNEAEKTIKVDWFGFLKLENIQEGSEGIIAAIKETGYGRILVDNRQIQGPWDVANEWYATDWNPRAYAAGMKALAVMVSENVFTKASLDNFSKTVENKDMFDVGTFSKDDEATEWLKNY